MLLGTDPFNDLILYHNIHAYARGGYKQTHLTLMENARTGNS